MEREAQVRAEELLADDDDGDVADRAGVAIQSSIQSVAGGAASGCHERDLRLTR